MARARIDGILADEVGMDASERVRRPIETDEAPAPIGPYSQAVVADGVLYCSGQVPLDPESGELVDGGIAEQARRCLESLDAVCRAAGTELSEAARIGIYLIDMSLFPELNEVYASFFSEPFPVRTTVGVAALPKGAQVEMDATVPLGRDAA
jgi:2-iminobutanoate/2-iminopropanoate deaminase